jgi:hypothetical protein
MENAPQRAKSQGVLRLVIDQYKYSSLEELNAVLGLYNVVADRGSPGSKMFEQEGLVFQLLDDQGEKVSASIKASALYMQPTLKKLQAKMKRNTELKKPHAKRVRSAIDFALLKKKAPDLNYLVGSLAKLQIQVLFRQTGEGFIYGMTFIDHQSKVVFNGSDLGKNYSAKNILERCQLPAWKRPVSLRPVRKWLPPLRSLNPLILFIDLGRMVTEWMAPEVYSRTFVVDGIPYAYRKTKKRKRLKK